MRMQAYYYEFTPTGVEAVDRILSAVATAGKACHNTADWNDAVGASYGAPHRGESPVEWIQNAANAAAEAFRATPASPPREETGPTPNGEAERRR